MDTQNSGSANYQDLIQKDIFELLGAQNAPDEKKKELYEKMLATIQNRVIIKITKDLADQDLVEWERVCKQGNRQEMADFLTTKNIDLDKMFLEETLAYKMELAELANPIKKAYQEKGKNK